jgi:hypothetical protein
VVVEQSACDTGSVAGAICPDQCGTIRHRCELSSKDRPRILSPPEGGPCGEPRLSAGSLSLRQRSPLVVQERS